MGFNSLNKRSLDEDAEMKIIYDFVEVYRKKQGIVPTPGRKIELSCEAFGEGYNLLYRQLILTTNGLDGWLEVKNSEVRKLVLDQILKESKKV